MSQILGRTTRTWEVEHSTFVIQHSNVIDRFSIVSCLFSAAVFIPRTVCYRCSSQRICRMQTCIRTHIHLLPAHDFRCFRGFWMSACNYVLCINSTFLLGRLTYGRRPLYFARVRLGLYTPPSTNTGAPSKIWNVSKPLVPLLAML